MKAFFSLDRNPGAPFLVFRQNFPARVAFSVVLLVFFLGRSIEAGIRAFPIPTGSQPISIILGPDGNFWFTLQDSSQIGRITPEGVITEFRTPTFRGDGKTQIDFGSCCQSAYQVLVQSDGIVTMGFPNSESSDSDFLLARLNSTGSLDSTFGIGGKVRTSFGSVNGGAQGGLLQADGKTVAVGFQATSSSGG
jgi:hypothetical protein